MTISLGLPVQFPARVVSDGSIGIAIVNGVYTLSVVKPLSLVGAGDGTSLLNLSIPNGIGSTFAPTTNITGVESFTAGTGYYIANNITSTRAGGTGHRLALSVEQVSSTASASEFVVGGEAIGRATAGSGLIFGWNPYAWADVGVAATAQVSGEEVNTDVRCATVTVKTGVQIVDVSTSVGFATVTDAGLYITNQVGGRGYGNAIQIGTNNSTQTGVANAGSILVTTGGTITNGINIGANTITNKAWISPGITIDGTGGLLNTTITSSGLISAGTGFYFGVTKIAGARDTGWTAMTNTANKATAYDSTTVTLAQLASRVKSLQDALTTHGLIGT